MRILLDGRAQPVLAPEPLALLWQFSDEQALSGLNAAIDRQLGGTLRNLLAGLHWQADAAAKLLCAGLGAGSVNLLLIGLGPRAGFEPGAFGAVLDLALQTLADLEQGALALSLPAHPAITGLAASLARTLVLRQTGLQLRLICAPADLEPVLVGLQQAKVGLKRQHVITIAVQS